MPASGHAKLLSVQKHFYYQDQAVYLCDLGYTTLVGDKTMMTIRCQNDGTWDAMLQNCTGMSCHLSQCKYEIGKHK